MPSHRLSPSKLLDLLFPTVCVGCACRGRLLCPACWQLLATPSPQRCLVCGRAEPAGRVCAPCSRAAGGLTGSWIAGSYATPVLRQAIAVLKYEGVPAMARPLGGLLFALLERAAIAEPLGRLRAPVLVPVPMDRARRRRRGSNHAVLLAREVSILAGLPIAAALTKRPRPPQASLDEAARLGNLRGAIAVRDPLAVFTKTAILVDDVVTTGATARACAAALRTAGARAVWLLALARG